jgi:hypothetical protein
MTKRPFEFKYSILLAFLLLILVLYPYLEQEGLPNIVLRGLFIATLFSTVYAAAEDRRHILISCVLFLPGLMGHFLDEAGFHTLLNRNPLLLSLPLYVFAVGTILRHLLREQKVTSDTLCGAASVYILTGVMWVPLYIAVENQYPGSFAMTGDAAASPKYLWDNLLYFSFTTLTTLGYGDISAKTPQAQSLAILEAINGVLYIAVLVSKLVGMNIEARRE